MVLELNNMKYDHAVELEEQSEAISTVWELHCQETADGYESETARQNVEMATQKERYEEQLRSAAELLEAALEKNDCASQMITEKYESALAEKDKDMAAAREEAEDAKSALTLMEGNHNNEVLDLQEDHEAVLKEFTTELTTTEARLQESVRSTKQLTKKLKALEGKLETQRAVTTGPTSQLATVKHRVAQLEIELAQAKAIAKIFLKNHHERTWRLKLRNSILVSANPTLLAGQENLQKYISDHQHAFIAYYEENKNLKIEVSELRQSLPLVDKDRYQLLEEIAYLMESAQQREFDYFSEISMVVDANNNNAQSADYYYQEMCNSQMAATKLQEDFDQACEANATVHKMFGDLKVEFDEYKEGTEVLEEKHDELETRLETLNKSAEKEREELTQAIIELQKDNQALREDAADSEEISARRIRSLTSAIRDPEHPDHRAVFEMFRNSDSQVQEVALSTDGNFTPFLVRNLHVEQAMVGQYEQMEGMFLPFSNHSTS